ncbi:hypothetical protein ABTL28_19485, partial [Acinetobacter baumannii]
LAGHATTGRTVTITDPNRRPVTFDPSVSGVLTGNAAPVFVTYPIMTANAGQAYTYKPAAFDANGDPLSFVLVKGPEGMTI